MKAGIAISPDTPSTAITDEIGNAVDMILVMTVYPGQWTSLHCLKVFDWRAGQGGQKFIERCVPKVSELRARFPDQNIEVDGGVGPSNVGVCAHAGSSLICPLLSCLPVSQRRVGSNIVVAGTAIFNAKDPEGVIAQLKKTVDDEQARIAAERQ